MEPPPPPPTDFDISANMPARWLGRAKTLYDKLNTIPELKWSDKGEMICNDQLIPGSNVVDLVHTFAKPGRRGAAKPMGWHEFGRALLANNVPRTIITNKQLWNEVEAPLPEPGVPPVRQRSAIPVRNGIYKRKRPGVITAAKSSWKAY